ncbi:MAG: ROK family protein [Dehalococcoidia bacterium]
MEKPVLAVDLGGTKIRSAIISQEGKLVAVDNRATQAYKGFRHVLDRLFDSIDIVLRKECLQTKEFSGIGVAIAGVLDSKNGILTSSPNLPHWRNVPLKQIIQDRLGLATFLINDANAAALGEHRFGAGTGAQDLVYLTVSTGIGGGIIIDGKLYEGSTGSAGELGHMTINAEGPRCNCGSYGCLEVLASGTAVAREAVERINRGETSLLKDMKEDASNIRAEDVAKAAKQGDKLAAEIIADASYYLGIGLANIVNIFNPQVIIIGGGMSKMGRMLIEPAKKVVKQRAFKLPARAAHIVRARLGNDSGIIGAAAHVINQ